MASESGDPAYTLAVSADRLEPSGLNRLLIAAVMVAALTAGCRPVVGGGSLATPTESSPQTTASASLPGWCGGLGTGGPAPLPPNTPRPLYTPDPHTVRCIAIENKSPVDMAIVEPGSSWGLIQACSGSDSTGPVPPAPWTLEVGRATPGSISGPDLASFDSSQLTGEPPYLIEVVINADLTATIQQRTSLPENPAVRYC
jgi:hypothetical protein